MIRIICEDIIKSFDKDSKDYEYLIERYEHWKQQKDSKGLTCDFTTAMLKAKVDTIRSKVFEAMLFGFVMGLALAAVIAMITAVLNTI